MWSAKAFCRCMQYRVAYPEVAELTRSEAELAWLEACDLTLQYPSATILI